MPEHVFPAPFHDARREAGKPQKVRRFASRIERLRSKSVRFAFRLVVRTCGTRIISAP
jgi:hypothetical protein